MSNNQYCLNKVCYFFDPPFISALDKQNLGQFACQYCGERKYCSEKCRDQDWNKQHNLQCPQNPDKLPSEEASEWNQSEQSASLAGSQRVTFIQDEQPQQIQEHQQTNNLHHVEDNQNRFLYDFEDVNKIIGQGSYGKVVLVKDLHNSQVYAMKIISKACLQDMTQQQLNREINIQKKLSHTNILKLFYFFQDRDYVHLVLEHASKGSITQNIKQQLSEEEIWIYFRQICLGINYLHSSNVIHRDLKPENILLDANSIVKLCDFGWSTEVNSDQQKRDTICGTIDYMAPEMIVSKGGYGPQVDIWSLGIVLYEFLNGQVPFKDGEHLTFNGQDLKMVNQDVSLEAKDLLQVLLEVDPQKRIKIKDIFSNSWFIKMAKSIKIFKFKDTNFDLQTISMELTYQKSPIIMNDMNYFDMDQEIQSYKQPRISRISKKNNMKKIDEQEYQFKLLKSKSLMDKISDIFGCVNRENINRENNKHS